MKCLVCDDGWIPGHRVTMLKGRKSYELGVCRRCEKDGYLLRLAGRVVGEDDTCSITTPDGKSFEVDPSRTKESTRTAKTKKSRRLDHPPLPGTEELFLAPGVKRRKRRDNLRDGEKKERRHG